MHKRNDKYFFFLPRSLIRLTFSLFVYHLLFIVDAFIAASGSGILNRMMFLVCWCPMLSVHTHAHKQIIIYYSRRSDFVIFFSFLSFFISFCSTALPVKDAISA